MKTGFNKLETLKPFVITSFFDAVSDKHGNFNDLHIVSATEKPYEKHPLMICCTVVYQLGDNSFTFRNICAKNNGCANISISKNKATRPAMEEEKTMYEALLLDGFDVFTRATWMNWPGAAEFSNGCEPLIKAVPTNANGDALHLIYDANGLTLNAYGTRNGKPWDYAVNLKPNVMPA